MKMKNNIKPCNQTIHIIAQVFIYPAFPLLAAIVKSCNKDYAASRSSMQRFNDF